MAHTIQQILGAFLSSHGEHDLAGLAYQSTDRDVWVRLGDLAIRTAPEWNRTDCARAIKLALDLPENGGKGYAADYEIRKEKHPMQEGAYLYCAYSTEGRHLGMVGPDLKTVYRRLVGAFVVRDLKLPEGETL